MRCECCDVILTELEEQSVFTDSGRRTNSCFACLSTMDVPYDVPGEDVDYVDVDEYSLEEQQLLYDDEELWDER